MMTEPEERDRSQDSEESRPEPDPATQDESSDPGSDAEAILARQIHRWKGEGGSLHPDE